MGMEMNEIFTMIAASVFFGHSLTAGRFGFSLLFALIIFAHFIPELVQRGWL